jgi:hypothetical protein
MGIMLLDETDDGLTLESNESSTDPAKVVSNQLPTINTWKIDGSHGYCYERQVLVNSENVETHTCSCPSFKYCKQVVKTCKHIMKEVD